jgi:hypothetical protein
MSSLVGRRAAVTGTGGLAMAGAKGCALSASLILLIRAAAAQMPSGPIVNGRQPQPTVQQLESAKDKYVVEWERWNSRVQPDVDRLYNEIMRAATPSGH